ncbi:hypothetical protein D9M72_544170 [compost metagenome]
MRQRPVAVVAHAHDLDHRVARLDPQRLGHIGRGVDFVDRDHLHRRLLAHVDDVVEQAGAAFLAGCGRRTYRMRIDEGAKPAVAAHQSLLHQAVEHAPHGHARGVELLGQVDLARQGALAEAAFHDLLAQYDVNLVIQGNDGFTHGFPCGEMTSL